MYANSDLAQVRVGLRARLKFEHLGDGVSQVVHVLRPPQHARKFFAVKAGIGYS